MGILERKMKMTKFKKLLYMFHDKRGSVAVIRATDRQVYLITWGLNIQLKNHAINDTFIYMGNDTYERILARH